MLIINLTDEQVENMASVYEKIKEMDDSGKPGALIAQVYSDHMRVGILNNADVRKIQEALGIPEYRRIVHRTAYDLMPQAIKHEAQK